MTPKPNTRPAWLVARVRYQCDLIDLCAREVEARGLLTSDVPERATAALRRWADGGNAPGDRASWALKGAVLVADPTGQLLYMVREAVRTRMEGERAYLDQCDSIGCRGLWAASSAQHLLCRVGVPDVQALRLSTPSDAVTCDDPEQIDSHARVRQSAALDWLRTQREPTLHDTTEAEYRAAFAKYEVREDLANDVLRMTAVLRPQAWEAA